MDSGTVTAPDNNEHYSILACQRMLLHDLGHVLYLDKELMNDQSWI